ncbi:Gag protein [Phytophthora cinnamomi]|uniref:Gag protein n=1 Tax=Phytophthora cinnamomi TaxID=4785 RepID=UPI00355A599C|nr:Gag protein [Phytophthora cinnamomi]
MVRTPGQQQGRTRTTGTGKLPKQFKRVAITYHHKRDVIEQVRSAHLTNQNAFDAEPDWALLDRLLDEVPVIRHFVDPNRDIDTLVLEEDNVDYEA